MQINLNQPLVNYKGQLFTRPVLGPDGQPVLDEAGRPRTEPMTLKGALESACLTADQQQYSTGAAKMMVFNILMKVHKADPIADLTVEEISTLKELTGKQLNVAAVGAVHAALENPVVEKAPAD